MIESQRPRPKSEQKSAIRAVSDEAKVAAPERKLFAANLVALCPSISVPFEGKRHSWNLRLGAIAPETLEWLRADPVFVKHTTENETMELCFEGEGKRFKTEAHRKFIVAGKMGGCASSSMCGLSLEKPLPAARIRAWLRAFLACNKKSLLNIQGLGRSMVNKMSKEAQGKNGQHFVTTDLEDWFISCGELCVTSAGSVADGFWSEPKHQDGGMSVFHMGITLAGNRLMTCSQGDGLPDIEVSNRPGTVYLGQLTGPEHQVKHGPSQPWDLLNVGGQGPFSCTVMCRTALFPFCRSRNRNHTPNPSAVFYALAQAFTDGLRINDFVLPTLAQCDEASVEMFLTEADEGSSAKKRKTID